MSAQTFAATVPSGRQVAVSVTSAERPETHQQRTTTAVARLRDHQKH